MTSAKPSRSPIRPGAGAPPTGKPPGIDPEAPANGRRHAIDEAAREILRCIDQDAPRSFLFALAGLEQELTSYVAREEIAMRRYSYPLTSGHEESHDLLLAKVGKLLERAAEDGASPGRRREAILEISSQIRSHALAYDAGFSTFLARLRR